MVAGTTVAFIHRDAHCRTFSQQLAFVGELVDVDDSPTQSPGGVSFAASESIHSHRIAPKPQTQHATAIAVVHP